MIGNIFLEKCLSLVIEPEFVQGNTTEYSNQTGIFVKSWNE